ncbi:MAG: hypothetical protein MUD00_03365 [Candidatus Pacebacteria bacterium]|jgi:hypothetical protein|nr:hypothetical protein [Candidatus Paceibacterota bacterium]
MDSDFKTSFIPKKPLAEERVPVKTRSFGLVSLIAGVIFFATLLAGVGVYLYKSSLTSQVAELSTSLARARAAFEPSLVETLQTLDKRLNASKEVLALHTTVSPIFRSLEDLTLKSVRFTKFGYEVDPDTNRITVKMSGTARSYTSIALQSDMLGKNKYFRDVVFSNLQLDAAGNVGFDLGFSVDPAYLNYSNTISAQSAPSSGTVPQSNN